jgi:hypothetical protein
MVTPADTLQGFGDVLVGELADVFGGDHASIDRRWRYAWLRPRDCSSEARMPVTTSSSTAVVPAAPSAAKAGAAIAQDRQMALAERC